MATNYITTGQHQIIHDLIHELDMSAESLANLWKVSGTARTYAAAARMITLLKVKLIYKHLGYDAEAIQHSILEIVNERGQLEKLESQELSKLYTRLKKIETERCDPENAALMVATMKVADAVAYDDQKVAIHACDKYEDETTLRVLFANGKAVRFSLGGQVFAPVDFRSGE